MKKDPVIIVLDVIIVILIFVMIYVGQSALFYKIRADRDSFSQDADMMSFELQRGDYAGLIRGKYANEINGDTKSTGYHALADYTEAAFRYRVYDTKGYTGRSKKEKSVMDEKRAAMKELSVYADRVDSMLGINVSRP